MANTINNKIKLAAYRNGVGFGYGYEFGYEGNGYVFGPVTRPVTVTVLADGESLHVREYERPAVSSQELILAVNGRVTGVVARPNQLALPGAVAVKQPLLLSGVPAVEFAALPAARTQFPALPPARSHHIAMYRFGLIAMVAANSCEAFALAAIWCKSKDVNGRHYGLRIGYGITKFGGQAPFVGAPMTKKQQQKAARRRAAQRRQAAFEAQVRANRRNRRGRSVTATKTSSGAKAAHHRRIADKMTRRNDRRAAAAVAAKLTARRGRIEKVDGKWMLVRPTRIPAAPKLRDRNRATERPVLREPMMVGIAAHKVSPVALSFRRMAAEGTLEISPESVARALNPGFDLEQEREFRLRQRAEMRRRREEVKAEAKPAALATVEARAVVAEVVTGTTPLFKKVVNEEGKAAYLVEMSEFEAFVDAMGPCDEIDDEDDELEVEIIEELPEAKELNTLEDLGRYLEAAKEIVEAKKQEVRDALGAEPTFDVECSTDLSISSISNSGLIHEKDWVADDIEELKAATREVWKAAQKSKLGKNSHEYICVGDYYWVWKGGKGAYLTTQPDGSPVVAMPEVISVIAKSAVSMLLGDDSYEPQVALINLYRGEQKLNLHKDVDEECDAPIVSISFGASGIFVADGVEYQLDEGDLLIMHGSSRYCLHGYKGNLEPDKSRVNITVRMVKAASTAQDGRELETLSCPGDDIKSPVVVTNEDSNRSMRVENTLAQIEALASMKLTDLKALAAARGLGKADIPGDKRKRETWIEALRENLELELNEAYEAEVRPEPVVVQVPAEEIEAVAADLDLSEEVAEVVEAATADEAPVEDAPDAQEEQLDFTIPDSVSPVECPIDGETRKAALVTAFGEKMAAMIRARADKDSTLRLAPQQVMYWPLVGASALIRQKAPLPLEELRRITLELRSKGADGSFVILGKLLGRDSNNKQRWVNFYPDLLLNLLPGEAVEGYVKRSKISKIIKAIRKVKSVPKAMHNEFAELFASAIALRASHNRPVLVPNELIEYGKAIGSKQLDAMVGFTPAMIKPARGFTYQEAKDIFAYLEWSMQSRLMITKANGVLYCGMPEDIDSRPMSFVDRGDEFDIFFGRHLRITVRSTGEVAMFRNDRRLRFTFKQVLWAAPRKYGRQAIEETVLLSAIDQLMYHMENYVFVDLNRRYPITPTGEALNAVPVEELCQKYIHYSIYQYFADHAKSEMAVATYENGQRKFFVRHTASVTEGCINLPWFKKGNHILLNAVNKDAAKELNARAAAVSLVERPEERNLMRRCILAANAWGQVLLPYGAMNTADTKFLCWKAADVRKQKKAIYLVEKVYRWHWDYWFGGTYTRAAMLSKITELFDEFSPELLKDLTVDTPEWWAKVTSQFAINWSTKESKAMKRNASNFAQVCRARGEELMAFIYRGESYIPTAKVVKAALALQVPAAPGVGYTRSNLYEAVYEVSGVKRRFYNPADNLEDTFVFVEELADKVVEDRLSGDSLGYRFIEPLKVKRGQLIGYFVDAQGKQQAVRAEYCDAELTHVGLANTVEMGFNKFFITLRYLKSTPTVKLRYGVKLNAVEANIDALLDAHGRESAAVDLFVPLDCNKWLDSADFPFPVIAETYKRYPEGRALLAEANKKAGYDFDNGLIFDRELRVTGEYDFLYQHFMQEFGTRIWYTSIDTVGEYAEVLTQLYASQDKWRVVTDAEREALTLPNGKFNSYVPSDAVVLTDAAVDADINSKEVCVFAAWTDEHERSTVMIGGFGLMGTTKRPLYYPTTIEYTTVEQAVTTTSMMPFSMMDLSLQNEGAAIYARKLVKDSDHRRDLQLLLEHMLRGTRLYNPATQSNLETVEVETVFTEEVKADLKAKMLSESSVTPAEWLAEVAKVVGNKSLYIPFRSLTGEQVGTLYLPAIVYLAGRSLDSCDDTIASKVYEYFVNVVNGHMVNSLELMNAAGDIYRIMEAFYNGVTNKKSVLRGPDTIYAKAAALPVIPTSCVYIRRGGKLYNKVVARFGQEVKYLGFRRMPMTRSAVFEVHYTNGYVGDYKLSGDRFYFGLFGQYFNWGDLDGDSDEFGDMTDAVLRGLVKPDNLETLKELFRGVLGSDMLNREFWQSGAPAQYWADHFDIPSYKKILSKIGFSASKSLTVLDKYIEFQEAAFDVQTVTVGGTYRATSIAMMLAEVLPLVFDFSGDWQGKFESVFRVFGCRETAREFCYRLQQLYEVALGGYDNDMAIVTLGSLIRAMSFDDEFNWKTLRSVKALAPEMNTVSGVLTLPELNEVISVKATVANPAVARKAFTALGFNGADYDTFFHLFQVAGLCRNLGTQVLPEDVVDEASPEVKAEVDQAVAQNRKLRWINFIDNKYLAYALGVTEIVMNVSQNRYAQNDKSLLVSDLEDMLAANPELVPFAERLKANTVTGALYAEFCRTQVMDGQLGAKVLSNLDFFTVK